MEGLDIGIPTIPGIDEIAAAQILIEIGDWIKQLKSIGRWPSPRPAAASA
jgi:transposase